MKKNLKVILSIESSRASGRDFLRGVARFAHIHGSWSFFWEPKGFEKVHETLQKRDVDGIMVRDLGGLEQQALRLGIPAVVLGHRGREIRGVINVVTDSQTVGRLAAEHLLQCGFKHFAYCGLARSSMEQISWSVHRFDAFSKRIAEGGFKLPPSFVLSSSANTLKKNRRELADWLLRLAHPIGVMACNDDCGSQVAEACKLAGLPVPDAVGIVGVDNDEVVCGLADPPMTSVAVNFERAGYQAAEALNRLMLKSKKKPEHKISALATHVIVRRSTGIVAVDDKHLGKALTCIRDRVGTPLSVIEVAKAAGISRRTLERSFRQQMGVSILKEIRRQRTDRIARLLLETNLPVARIADSLGFSDVQHFARYFRSGKQMSPLAFRKKHGSQSLS